MFAKEERTQGSEEASSNFGREKGQLNKTSRYSIRKFRKKS